jgi:TPR repeat protein
MKKIVIGIGIFFVLAIAAFAMKSDSKIATELRCNFGSGTDCYELLKDSKGDIAEINSENFKFLQKACDYEIADACVGMAYAYRDGKNAIKNPEQAKIFFEKASNLFKKSCANSNGKDCYEAANFNESLFAKRPTTKKEIRDIAELLEKGCRLEHKPACTELSDIYLLRHYNLSGLDIKSSAELFEFSMQKSCESEPKKYCGKLAEYYLFGDEFSVKNQFDFGKFEIMNLSRNSDFLISDLPGGKENKERISHYLDKACLSEDANSCIGLADFDVSRRRELLTKSCSLNNSEGCFLAGLDWEIESGKSATVIDFYKKACSLGLKQICNK